MTQLLDWVECIYLIATEFLTKTQRMFSRITHMLGHKTNAILNIFPPYNVMRVEIYCRSKIGKVTNMWKLNNTPFNNQGVEKKSKEKLENTLRQIKMGT
jgi:hypothetical protein